MAIEEEANMLMGLIRVVVSTYARPSKELLRVIVQNTLGDQDPNSDFYKAVIAKIEEEYSISI